MEADPAGGLTPCPPARHRPRLLEDPPGRRTVGTRAHDLAVFADLGSLVVEPFVVLRSEATVDQLDGEGPAQSGEMDVVGLGDETGGGGEAADGLAVEV